MGNFYCDSNLEKEIVDCQEFQNNTNYFKVYFKYDVISLKDARKKKKKTLRIVS